MIRSFFVALCMASFFSGTLLGVESSSPIDKKCASVIESLRPLAKERNFAEIPKKLTEIDEILGTELDNAVVIGYWVEVLGSVESEMVHPKERMQTGIEKYLWKVANLDTEIMGGRLTQLDFLVRLLMPDRLQPKIVEYPYPYDQGFIETRMDSQRMVERAERVSRLLELLVEIHSHYEPDWAPNDPKNIPKNESKKYPFISSSPDLRPNPKTEPEEAAMYERFVQAMSEFWDKRSEQEELARLFPKKFEEINQLIARAYRLEPRADKELVGILEKSDYPLEERVEILAELDIPYKDFRKWESRNGRLKVVAKMVSCDSRDVVLEKADGDTISLKLTELSRKDRTFISEQRKVEKEE